MNIKIITDGGCDISKEYIKKYDIEILPIAVNDGIEEYFGDDELSSNELFKNMRNKKVYGTSQVGNMDYIQCFEKYASENREIIYISLSSGITGTYDAALRIREEVLKKYKSAKIHVFDSFCATCGLGLMVHRAAMMAADGRDSKYILNALEFLKAHQEHVFSVTTLEFLVRGGRVSKGSAAIGGILNIKPIMELTKTDGKITSLDKARGENNLYKKLSEELAKKSGGKFNTNQSIIIAYGDDVSFAERLKNHILSEYNISEQQIYCNQLGTVIGAHTGPDFVGVFFLSKLFEDYNEVR
ncbi:DegV family protein [Peptoniphilus mikwangii]|uniref:DegV family protein n=1 Tax=Peptoniphilus mikwangii TaxID=1354300 RepID=UPI00040581CE|nr:DegV family protein [Peptoniphilus mikwangii]